MFTKTGFGSEYTAMLFGETPLHILKIAKKYTNKTQDDLKPHWTNTFYANVCLIRVSQSGKIILFILFISNKVNLIKEQRQYTITSLNHCCRDPKQKRCYLNKHIITILYRKMTVNGHFSI